MDNLPIFVSAKVTGLGEEDADQPGAHRVQMDTSNATVYLSDSSCLRGNITPCAAVAELRKRQCIKWLRIGGKCEPVDAWFE
jgi:hypothetical protein